MSNLRDCAERRKSATRGCSEVTRAGRSVALAKNVATVRGTRMEIENSVGTHSFITYNREKEI